MKKIEAKTLQEAYTKAADEFNCSVTELVIEVVQYPSSGFLGLFGKKAIIVATKKISYDTKNNEEEKEVSNKAKTKENTLTDTQENIIKHEEDVQSEVKVAIEDAVNEIRKDINDMFKKACFDIEDIVVNAYDEQTVYIEINGNDAALLIGKEGYRYKALSYMLFNWINLKYGLQIRLEIAEFLKNQEEAVRRYLEGVKDEIDSYGRTQTKILDGVLVQIALRELRNAYPDKYVAIRTTRDGLKYIIVNDYNTY